MERGSSVFRNTRMRLLLIRHGRDDAPPRVLADEVARAEYLVAGDTPRAIASAECLADGRPILQSPLLNETPLEVPAWLPERGPLPVRDAWRQLKWGYDVLRGADVSPQEIRRAVTATKWLTRLAHDQSPIVAVTHGIFRRLLATRLVAAGWQPDGRWRSSRHWSTWAFRIDGNGDSDVARR